ncbi:MAG: histone-like nucleoid-structuring protein Lsr2 [Sciscionella sp.]
MAKKVLTTTEFTDDLDGSKAAGTVSFSFDGVAYEIDLSKKNAAAFTKAITPYIESARKVRGTARTAGRRRTSRSSARAVRGDLGAVRAWAAENGYAVAARGRIPAAIMDAYTAAT